MKSQMHELAVLTLFLLVLYPLVQSMTLIKGRAGMFRWRHQLNQGEQHAGRNR